MAQLLKISSKCWSLPDNNPAGAAMKIQPQLQNGFSQKAMEQVLLLSSWLAFGLVA